MKEDIPSPSADVTLLDCTLRDGGYYNDWDFSPALVREYLEVMSSARVPIVELGFRSVDRSKYFGPTFYTTDRYIESLNPPSGLTLGVMVNAKDLVAGESPGAIVDQLFNARASSRVELVRIAAHVTEVPGLASAVERLHQLGYSVGVNLMQIATKTDDEIAGFGALVSGWGISMAYFADSFGGMLPNDIARVVAALRGGFGGPIGCHTHDNMGLAFANSLAAIDAGATYVDSTLLGMGRGPGNTRTEYLAMELRRRGLSDVDGIALLPLVEGPFSELHAQYDWGSSPYYFLSATNNIHPTYIQEMTKDGRYTVRQIVSAVSALADGGTSYSERRIAEVTSESVSCLEGAVGAFDATGWCEGREVLIVGPGPAGVERRQDIEAYIRRFRPIVVALNAVPPVCSELVDAYAICSSVRVSIDEAAIAAVERPVYMPASLAAQLAHRPSGLRDYGLRIERGHFEALATYCTLPHPGAFGYALALATIGGATAIGLTGFDGFAATDQRQALMQSLLDTFTSSVGAPLVRALTRTSYRIAQSSIYAD